MSFNTGITWKPCCGDTLALKGGTLPMGSCDLHMKAPEMLELLHTIVSQIEMFNTVHDHNYFPGTLREIKELLTKIGGIK